MVPIGSPYIAMRSTRSQLPVLPRRQRPHSPHEIWNGTLTTSPGREVLDSVADLGDLRHAFVPERERLLKRDHPPHDQLVEVAGRDRERPHDRLAVALELGSGASRHSIWSFPAKVGPVDAVVGSGTVAVPASSRSALAAARSCSNWMTSAAGSPRALVDLAVEDPDAHRGLFVPTGRLEDHLGQLLGELASAAVAQCPLRRCDLDDRAGARRSRRRCTSRRAGAHARGSRRSSGRIRCRARPPSAAGRRPCRPAASPSRRRTVRLRGSSAPSSAWGFSFGRGFVRDS